MFVLDASVALAWCLDDETSEFADRILAQLDLDDAIVPAIWPLEVANGLRTAERRGRVDVTGLSRVHALLLSLPVRVEAVLLGDAFGSVTDVARRSDISVYDASYLVLAARRHLRLATMDDRLRQACLQTNVELVL